MGKQAAARFFSGRTRSSFQVRALNCCKQGEFGHSLLDARISGDQGYKLKVRKERPRAGSRGRHLHVDTGLHIVALFEAAKGVVVILAGLGLLALIHRDVQAVAESFVRHIHLNPARHFPHIFLDAAARATDARLWAMALTAMLYAAIRFAEAYGLWRKQIWAEWFGILSGAFYLPVEIYELTLSVTVVKITILIVNLIVVGWLSHVRWQDKQSAKH
jgi:uncharacterized membrane protein (DUF2068 family)